MGLEMVPQDEYSSKILTVYRSSVYDYSFMSLTIYKIDQIPLINFFFLQNSIRNYNCLS